MARAARLILQGRNENRMNQTNRRRNALWFATALCFTIAGCAQVPSHIDLASMLKSQDAKRSAKTPPQAEKMLTVARSVEKQGKFEEAIKHYDQIVKRFPNEGRAYHRLAVCHDRTSDDSDSSRLYLRALHFSPNNPELLCDYGYSRYVHGDLLQAETILRRAIKIDSSLARGHANLGLVLARQGKKQDAIASFVRSGLSESAAQENLQKLPAPEAVKVSKATNVVSVPAKVESSDIVLGEVGLKTGLSEQELLELLTKDAANSNVQYVSDSKRKSIRR